MSPEAAAEQGLYTRLTGDAALRTLLGTGVRIVPGWPADTFEPTDLPRITFYAFGPGPRRPGFARVRVTLDLWVWPTGTTGGRPKLVAIDERVQALCDEVHYSFGGYRHYSLADSFRDFPAPPGAPMRRMREIILETSPLS